MTEIYYAMDHILIVSKYCGPDVHKHLMKHLLISLGGTIDCVIEGETVSCKGIIISSQINHTIINKGNKMLLFLFDDSTNIAAQMEKKYLKGKAYYLLQRERINEIKEIWDNAVFEKCVDENIKDDYMTVYRKILNVCNLDVNYIYIKDERIKKILVVLNNMEGINKETLKDLASEVCLSQSRMSHLFKAETGIALSSFLLLMKISKAYKYIFSGESVTEACLKAGFDSSSHFATVNKRCLGMSIRYETSIPIKFIWV